MSTVDSLPPRIVKRIEARRAATQAAARHVCRNFLTDTANTMNDYELLPGDVPLAEVLASEYARAILAAAGLTSDDAKLASSRYAICGELWFLFRQPTRHPRRIPLNVYVAKRRPYSSKPAWRTRNARLHASSRR